MTDVSIISTHDLTEQQRRDIIDVCIAAHDEPGFEDLFSYLTDGGRHFLGYDAGMLVSHAVVTTRWVQPQGLPQLRTAFVDAVSTLPATQGRGHCSAVMKALAAGIDDYEIGCLQTDIEPFYERLDWERWRGPLFGRDGDALVPTPDQRGVMILRLAATPALDLDAMLSIERQPNRFWEG